GGARMAEFHVVLVVDSDAEARDVATRALRERGFLVAHASTVGHALELMRHVAVDVLLTDLAVLAAPGGRALVDAARRGNPAIRVICVAGFVGEAAEGGTPDVCQHLLRKPYRAEQLSSEI